MPRCFSHSKQRLPRAQVIFDSCPLALREVTNSKDLTSSSRSGSLASFFAHRSLIAAAWGPGAGYREARQRRRQQRALVAPPTATAFCKPSCNDST